MCRLRPLNATGRWRTPGSHRRGRSHLEAGHQEKAATGDAREAAALDLEAALFRDRGRSRLGLTAAAHVATAEELSFDQVALAAELEHNLAKRDFLPVAVQAKAESDQAFDVVDLSAQLELRYILPLYLNRSPFDAFSPALGPKVRLQAAFGRRVRGAGDEEADFARAGYEVVWRIPLSANGLLRLHHAGVWDWSDLDSDEGGAFHALWDLALEQKLGELTYFIDYQKGAAAPLFLPTETTRAGVVIRFQ